MNTSDILAIFSSKLQLTVKHGDPCICIPFLIYTFSKITLDSFLVKLSARGWLSEDDFKTIFKRRKI
jgi:hypothetical protein